MRAGSLGGRVTDPSGAAAANARVTLFGQSRTITAVTVTGSDGRFEFSGLNTGDYLLSISRAGFAGSRSAVSIAPRGDAELAIVLSLSPVSNEVTVTAEIHEVESVDRVPQRVNVISAGEIAERAPTAVTEAAEGEPGVHQLRTSSGMGAFVVRGLTGKNVAVYRDNVRFTNSVQRGGVSTFQNLVDAGQPSGDARRAPCEHASHLEARRYAVRIDSVRSEPAMAACAAASLAIGTR